MKRLQLELCLRAGKILSVLLTLWFFFWAVVWQAIWWQPPIFGSDWSKPNNIINTLGFALSFISWVSLDLLLAHPELLAQIALPKWLRKAASKTTEKKIHEGEEGRQPVY